MHLNSVLLDGRSPGNGGNPQSEPDLNFSIAVLGRVDYFCVVN